MQRLIIGNTIFLLRAFILSLICFSTAWAQIKITSPVDRAIYQRDQSGQTNLSVAGRYSQPIDQVEIRAIPVIPGQGIATDWSILQSNPSGGFFLGTIRLQGGWYTLEVKASFAGIQVGRDVLPRVGVGEVFLISGQSNAQGLRDFPGLSAQDDRVNYVVFDNTVNSLFDPPKPAFAQLTSAATIGPRGQGAWCYGLLGDLLVRKLNVPVLFINTAWDGTSVRNWAESADGKITKNVFGGFNYPTQMPYGNLLIASRFYAHQFGARAILWMQGESDTFPLDMSSQEYQQNLQFLMNKLGSDVDKRLYWVIARTSRTSDSGGNTITSEKIINGQNAVINTTFNATFPGPITDNLFLPRPDGTHFEGPEGNVVLANTWNETLNTSFFTTITPVLPSAVPAITVSCGPDNGSIQITAPEGYSKYEWSTGQTTRIISAASAGTYELTLKDKNGNVILAPSITLSGSARPERPTIIPSNPQQACADTGYLFSASGGNDLFLWSNNAIGQTARPLQTGNYTVKARNVFGCESEISVPVSLTVRPSIAKPFIEKSGPYSLAAIIPTSGFNESFEWRKGVTPLPAISQSLKVTQTDSYSVRAKATFTLGNNTLTCYSPFSNGFNFSISEDDGIVIFPNPTRGGVIAVETREDLSNAEVAFYNNDGTIVLTRRFAILRERQVIDATTLPPGLYLVRVRAPGVDVTKRIAID
jgi:hypothetical protein